MENEKDLVNSPSHYNQVKELDDPINPNHYKQGKIQTIDFIEDQGFDYHIGNAVKYICRHEHKGNPIQDLEKAIWYIKRKVENLLLKQKTFIEKPVGWKATYGTAVLEEVPTEILVKNLVSLNKNEEPLQVKFPNDFENHVMETCRWGGCFKCDPKGHKI